MLKDYFTLSKPGIVIGNTVNALGGFFYASESNLILHIFLPAMIGLNFIVAGACVFNNIYDADIDGVMKRTKNRVMVRGRVSRTSAFIYGTILSLIGFGALAMLDSMYAFWVGAFAFFIYVVAYTMWSKRQSTWGTFIGSLSGASPALAGYVAVVNSITVEAIFIFVLFTIWQMPHSYGIAINRFADYKKAGINVLPVVEGFDVTRNSIVIYISSFVSVLAIFGFMGHLHTIGFLFVLAIAMYWLATATFVYTEERNEKWAKQIFVQSIFMVIVLNLCLGFNGKLMGL